MASFSGLVYLWLRPGAYPRVSPALCANNYTTLEAGKACQGQTLYLISKIRKLRTKKLYDIVAWGLCYKTNYRGNLP